MFERIARLFAKPDPEVDEVDEKLSVGVLLVHLAGADGAMSGPEREAIREGLKSTYALSDPETEALIADALRRDAEAVDFYQFTSGLSALPLERRHLIIELMWRVVFTDGTNHELEDNTIWRVAELIHVPTRDRTTLRRRVARAYQRDPSGEEPESLT